MFQFLAQFCACACSKVVCYFEPKMNIYFYVLYRKHLNCGTKIHWHGTVHDFLLKINSMQTIFNLLTVLLSDTISASRFFNKAAPCPGGPVAMAFRSCRSRYIPRGGFLLFLTLWRNDWALFGPGLLFNNFWPPSGIYRLYCSNWIFINTASIYSILSSSKNFI